MAASESQHKPTSVQIEHSGRKVDALEWKTATSITTVVIAVDGGVSELVSPVAEKLMDRHRVLGVNLRSAWDAVTIAWGSQDPIVLLAQGESGRTACETAQLAPGALRALVLADYAPKAGNHDAAGVVVPVLVFHGRESSAETHAQAVRFRDEISGSHLIELDGCAELPTKNCATALAESLTWYLDELGKPVMEFEEFAGAEKEPLDPRA